MPWPPFRPLRILRFLSLIALFGCPTRAAAVPPPPPSTTEILAPRGNLDLETAIRLAVANNPTVVIGGILSSTLLTLVVLPVLYRMAHDRERSS